MWLMLFKTFEGIFYYGDIPDSPSDSGFDPRVEIFLFDIERIHWNNFEDDFIFPVNRLCSTVLDFGDIDYVNAAKCKKLKEFLEKKLSEVVFPEFESIYEKLLEFVNKAIKYKTGVNIQL